MAALHDDDFLRDYTRVRLDGDTQVVEVGIITWQGAHSPELSWVEAARLPAEASADDVDRARAASVAAEVVYFDLKRFASKF